MGDPEPLAVCACTEASLATAEGLARSLGCLLAPVGVMPRDYAAARALLLVSDDKLALQLCGRKMPGPVSVDFGSSGMRHRRAAGHNELLGKAVGVGRKSALSVIDATAGLGRDSFVLADLGARVRLCERHPVIAAMLEAGMDAARNSGDSWLVERVSRMQLHKGDACLLPPEQLVDVDVIYLDPMFPARTKAAAVKKEMALFQYLLHDSSGDGEATLHWALQQQVARVVVKRPARAEALAGVAPSHSIEGRAVRYDVHVLAALG
ncbi:hypothetical protein F0M18_09135 [Pseudohalioglobus sediminis]|uniref:Ribosomal RNA small subunit methyltransferase J n=1 Tax=Pseudohalioglobus sediminis TaxID=2606449 RepID=A0A5B0X2N6_9GAMM|nr:class I SAM-dependent methyltransferase [Pseudohalioglobus sediminis]KAA1192807.1 hypothetical protein F0M18_09135 [Pseudohalioglobus sediminis]